MAADRTLRSVFVGNIPYDASEEKLREIFSTVGPVLSFRIVFDRDSGKPKGYGFCEYKDQETATSAIRNLNNRELNGRNLRVDSATNERGRDDHEPNHGNNNNNNNSANNDQQQIVQHQHPVAPVPEPQGDPQTQISNVVNGLSPELLIDLCKQLKASLRINPEQTRQLLVQNPQLSYAILISLVRIKAIDAPTAMSTLHNSINLAVPLQPMLPMMAPMAAAPIPTVQAPANAPLVMQPQPSIVMQPQVMAPFAFLGDNTMVAPNNANHQPQTHLPNVPMTSSIPSLPTAAPADPRLARQQKQHVHQEPQQMANQSQSTMSEQERQAFLMQVMSMTDQEISLLPPDQQDKIYQLKRQYISNTNF